MNLSFPATIILIHFNLIFLAVVNYHCPGAESFEPSTESGGEAM